MRLSKIHALDVAAPRRPNATSLERLVKLQHLPTHSASRLCSARSLSWQDAKPCLSRTPPVLDVAAPRRLSATSLETRVRRPHLPAHCPLVKQQPWGFLYSLDSLPVMVVPLVRVDAVTHHQRATSQRRLLHPLKLAKAQTSQKLGLQQPRFASSGASFPHGCVCAAVVPHLQHATRCVQQATQHQPPMASHHDRCPERPAAVVVEFSLFSGLHRLQACTFHSLVTVRLTSVPMQLQPVAETQPCWTDGKMSEEDSTRFSDLLK